MKTILPFDELNNFKTKLSTHFEKGRIKSKEDCEDIIDEILDLCLLAYVSGAAVVGEQLNVHVTIETTAEELEEVLYPKVDGKDWRERVREWYENEGTEADIIRIAETETHRIGNESAEKTAVKAGAKEKTWRTMMDDKVRDSHFYLESTTVPIDARFYTYDGDSARFPGDFTLAENNIGCRCELQYR